MQNVSSDTTNNNEKIDKGSNLQELGKVSTPHSFNTSPIKSEFNPSYAEIFLSDTSDSEDDDVSEVEAFVIDQDDLADEAEMEEKYYLPSEEDSEDTVDPETQARLEALLEAAGIGKLASVDGKLADPEVLRRLTSSVSCALDEAAAALTRMRNENPRPQNERSLVQACSDGDVKTVKKLLTEGRSVHETTDEGESLLSLACSAGYYELAQVLLAMHANVEDRGIKGECTPLMEAASSGFIEIVRLLVNHGADVNGQSSSGNTPLMYACAGGHEAVVRVLLECGANVEDHNENGHTPLMEAASAGHVGVAKILLEYGAGINTHSNEFKESALTLACYKGHLDMVRFLLSAGADQEHKTDEMHTALMEASMDGHVEVAKLLLDSGAQVNMPTDSFESPLTLAACGGHVDLALLLIERGANIEEVNDEGYTPLMEAAREGHEEMVCVLLQKGAKINAHTEETQETALTLACCGGFLDVADFLLKNGANIELGASTPLMEAAQEGHLELVRYLLDSGAQVHAKTQTGDTALTYACENGHTDVADLLLSYGANLEHESEGGRTPLMKACRAGHLCTVQFLISKNADVNRQTSNNDHTPLSLACAGGHLNVVQLLLAHNADPYHKLKDNSTMLIEAAKGGHTNVVQLLLDFPRSVINGSVSSPSEESSPHVCSQGEPLRLSPQQSDEIINQVFEPKEQTAANVTASAANVTANAPNVTTNPGGVAAHPASVAANPVNLAANHASVAASPANVAVNPANVSVNPANVAANSDTSISLLNPPANLSADRVREKLHSLNLQQLKLLQKEKLQLQELQTRHIDILEFKKKKAEENSGKVAISAPTSNGADAGKVPKAGPPVQEKQTQPVKTGSDPPPTSAKAKQKTKAPSEDQNKTKCANRSAIDYLKSLNAQKAQQNAKCQTPAGGTHSPGSEIRELNVSSGVNSQSTNTKTSLSSQTSSTSQTTTVKSQTSVNSQKSQASTVKSQTSGETSQTALESSGVTFKTKPSVRVPCPTPVANAIPTPTSLANATATPTPVSNPNPATQTISTNPNPTTCAVCPNIVASQALPTTACSNAVGAHTLPTTACPNVVGAHTLPTTACPNAVPTPACPNLIAAHSLPTTVCPNFVGAQASPAIVYAPNSSAQNSAAPRQVNVSAHKSSAPNSSAPPLTNYGSPHVDVPLLGSRTKMRKALQNLRLEAQKNCNPVPPASQAATSDPAPPPLTSSKVQQVTNAPQALVKGLGLSPADINDAEMSFLLQDPKCQGLLQDPKCQGPLANFFQSQFFIDHLKRMKVKEQTGSGDAPSSPTPPSTPPPHGEQLRPVTPPLPPLNYFGVDTSPPRPGVAQGLVVGTQPLFHPGANTTVLHNTIYTRSSVPVPSPADVNQSTAIADRPKAKPVSKKEGKNVKKHQLAAFHLAMQQQKEALQLKQLVEMNEQLVSQVVSQQKQLVLNHSTSGTDADHTTPSTPILSNDILADSMARSKLLASTAKEMMESMSVKVDMDQETRDLIDQLESITMEEVERAASEGQKKLLLNKHYAQGLQDGLNALAANNEPRFQAVPNLLEQVDFVGARGPEEAYQYFTVPSPGGPVQVQQYPNGFQLQYQVSRQEISQYAKVDGKGSPFSSPTLSPKNDCNHSPPPTDVCLTPTPTQVVATQTSPEQVLEIQPTNPVAPSVEAPPVCVKKPSLATNEQREATPWTKGKKRQARPSIVHHASACANNNATVDPNNSRFPGSSTDTSSPSSVSANPSYSGMDVDSETESNHDTALTLACAGGHEELVELLLSRGADIEHRDKKGFTPLILAATAGHDKVVDILLNHVADMEAQSERTKDTPLSLACSGGRYEVVELLLTRGANKEHRNVSDYTPLSLAASGGYVNIIKLLLTHGAEINSRTGSKLGISPLMLAAMNGHTAAVKLLLDMGSDINAQIETNRNTALTLACFQGRHEVVSLLLDRKANVEHRAKTGLTPLMEAASGGYVEVGRVLLDKGADVNAPPVPSSRDTALTIAADKGHCRFVELLLSKGAQVEVKNKKGNSPLWLAANGGHLSVVELLWKHKADIDSQDNRKVSCLMAAFRKGHVKAVRWMVNHVIQFPSDQEMTRYIQTVNDKELLDKCQECSMVIRVAKNQQAERANKNANILLEELDMEKWREESKRAAQARKRERKKQKKLEKKEQRKAKGGDEDDDEEEMELEEEENDMETTTGRGEGEEGDSGIDANSQASCSSNEVKPGTTAAKSKNKKKKKSATAPNVPAKVTSTSKESSKSLVKNASASAVTKQSETAKSSSKSASVESTGSKKEKKKLQQAVAQPQTSSSNSTTNPQPISKSSSQSSSKDSKKQKPVAPPPVVENREEVVAPVVNGNESPPSKEKKPKAKLTTTPRKEPQHLIFESTRHPAEREDFEATGTDSKVNKHASLMSLYSDGELIASSSGVKIPSKQQAGKREEGWKEVVRKYLNTTFRHKKVSVPLNAISRVIGRGGSNINAIRSATTAHIEVEKQCKGQGERIITIKGNNEAIKQAHALIHTLIKDPDVDLVKLLADTTPPAMPPIVAPAPSKVKPTPAVNNTATSSGTVSAKVNPPAPPIVAPTTSAAPPPLLGSLTFAKAPAPPQPTSVPLPPQPQAIIPSAPTPLIPGLRASAPRPAAPRIVAAAAEKQRAPAPPRLPAPTPPVSTASSSASIPPNPPSTPSPSPQPRPLPTASAPPCISTPATTSASSSTPCIPSPTPPPSLAPLPSPQPPGLTEYSLFNDTFTKVTQQSVWGREDEDQSNMNFASAAGNSGANSEPSPPTLDVANLAKAPGYRGTTSVSSPVLCRMSTSASPLYQQPRPTSMYIEDPSPLYQQDLLKMVPVAPGPSSSSYMPQSTTSFMPQTSTSFMPQTTTVSMANYMTQSTMSNMTASMASFMPQSTTVTMASFMPQSTTVSMSRLNPRAPDFSSVKPQQQAPLFNASIPPPVLPTLTRWPGNYPMSYNAQPGPDMMSQLLAMENFGTMEMTPPTSPPHAMDERKVQPRPIGTERAWKNYNNLSTPVEEPAPWLQQEKTFGGIGDNRHMFRNSMPQYSRLPLPEDLAPPLPPLDNYQEPQPMNYNMNVNGVGATTLMLLPQQQQQTFAGLSSLLPVADNSWLLSDVEKQPAVWAKWTN